MILRESEPLRRVEQPVSAFAADFQAELTVLHYDIHLRTVEVKRFEMERGPIGVAERGEKFQLGEGISDFGLWISDCGFRIILKFYFACFFRFLIRNLKLSQSELGEANPHFAIKYFIKLL
jgi:hypothetical protein